MHSESQHEQQPQNAVVTGGAIVSGIAYMLGGRMGRGHAAITARADARFEELKGRPNSISENAKIAVASTAYGLSSGLIITALLQLGESVTGLETGLSFIGKCFVAMPSFAIGYAVAATLQKNSK